MEKNKTDRILYLDYLRILAMVAVITIHCSAHGWCLTDIHTFEWNVYNIYDSIVRWATPVFVMVSGALFLNEEKEISISKLYTKNIFRIATAFCFWSMIYALCEKERVPKDIAENFVHGHFHMWFLYMIVGLYILVPMIRKITKSRDMTKYFLLIAFIFSFLMPTLLRLPVICKLESTWNNLDFHFTQGFISYFVLGYYLHSTDFSKRKRIIIYILGLIGFGATILLTRTFSLQRQEPYEYFFDPYTINVLLESIAVFVFAKYELGKIRVGEKVKRFILNLSQFSFGIYLAHPLILETINNTLHLYPTDGNALITVPLFVIVVFAVSAVISGILNQIPGVKRYIV